MDDINPIELLKEEMLTEEVYLKVNAIHRLKIVVMVLGPQETQAQLLPYLESKHAHFCSKQHFSSHQPGGWWSPFRYCRRARQNMGVPPRQDPLLLFVGEVGQVWWDRRTWAVSAFTHHYFRGAERHRNSKRICPYGDPSRLRRMVHRSCLILLSLLPRLPQIRCSEGTSAQEVYGALLGRYADDQESMRVKAWSVLDSTWKVARNHWVASYFQTAATRWIRRHPCFVSRIFDLYRHTLVQGGKLSAHTRNIAVGRWGQVMESQTMLRKVVC